MPRARLPGRVVPDRLYWMALALFGLAATARGAVGLAGPSPGVGSYVAALGGLVVLGASVAGLVRGEQLDGGADSALVRGAAVGGALLYTVFTVVDLLG